MTGLKRLPLGAALIWVSTLSPPARAEREGVADDDYHLSGQYNGHLLLFQQAVAPGPGGALVRTETRVPFVQYVNLDASRLDTPLGRDTCAIELSLWGGAEFTDVANGSPLQGDVQTAAITFHTTGDARDAWVKLGRQVQAGGAARFARFDGANVGVALVPELTLSAYGGLMVLPRWNQRTGYYHLGSAADSLLRNPEAFEQAGRGEYAVWGGKLSYDHKWFRGALSFHEQRDEGQLGRRNLGFDWGVPIVEQGFIGTSLIFDMDAFDVSSARVFGDVWLGQMVELGAEYLKVEPALLLSHQSVLSVFGTSGYQEAGGTLGLRPLRRLRLTGSGYLQFYEDSLPGTRLDAGVRFATSDGPEATVLFAGYGRVDAVEVGYNSARIAINQPLPRDITATLQGYAYLYDEEIEGYRSSLTGSLSVSYPFAKRWQLLWAGLMTRSPYAAMDASTQLRLSYQFVMGDEGAGW